MFTCFAILTVVGLAISLIDRLAIFNSINPVLDLFTMTIWLVMGFVPASMGA